MNTLKEKVFTKLGDEEESLANSVKDLEVVWYGHGLGGGVAAIATIIMSGGGSRSSGGSRGGSDGGSRGGSGGSSHAPKMQKLAKNVKCVTLGAPKVVRGMREVELRNFNITR